MSLLRDGRWFYIGAYVVLWSSQAILIKSSQTNLRSDNHRQYPYDILAMTLCIELFKLTFSLAVFFLRCDSSSSATNRRAALTDKFPEGTYFMIPAAIYSIYNGLAFLNLQLMEPGTYRVLINVRIAFSGLLLQRVFHRRLSPRQWSGLVLLMIACAVEQSGSFSADDGAIALIMMSAQGLCSSLGGVYFQWLLQRRDLADMDVWLKNIFLYFWSIVFHVAAIVAFRPALAASPAAFASGFDAHAVAIIIMAGLGGVCTSLVLRHLDVLVKEYANFAEMVAVALAQRVLFGTPLRPSLIAAIVVVCYSLYLYQVPAAAASTTRRYSRSHQRLMTDGDDRPLSPKSP